MPLLKIEPMPTDTSFWVQKVFINGRFVSGAVPLEDIAKVIDEELKANPSIDMAA
jgi:hypothetical protein